jgi:hypothetical protein
VQYPSTSGIDDEAARVRPLESSGCRNLAHRVPTVPGDAEDHECDDEPDDRIRYRKAQRNNGGARQDAEADKAIYARMITSRRE